MGGRSNAPARISWVENGQVREFFSQEPTKEIINLSQKLGGEIGQLQVTRPNLEEIYLKMIGELQ